MLNKELNELIRQSEAGQRGQLFWLPHLGRYFSAERVIIHGCDISELDENRVKSYYINLFESDDAGWEGEKDRFYDCHGFVMAEYPKSNPYVTFFACIFFAENPCRHLPQAGIRLSVFSNKRDGEGRDVIIDEVLDIPFLGLGATSGEETSLPSRAIELLKPHISHESKNAWDYPPLVVQELITNAFAHRDWTRRSQIEVAVYADCLEVTSPGTLSGDMTLERLKWGVREVRNNKIARILQDCGFIKNRGMGIRRHVIPEMLKENGCEPIFEATEDYFRVILQRKHAEVTPHMGIK